VERKIRLNNPRDPSCLTRGSGGIAPSQNKQKTRLRYCWYAKFVYLVQTALLFPLSTTRRFLLLGATGTLFTISTTSSFLRATGKCEACPCQQPGNTQPGQKLLQILRIHCSSSHCSKRSPLTPPIDQRRPIYPIGFFYRKKYPPTKNCI
jgi:hypothetical protein